MCRGRPIESGDHRRVAGDRRGRMKEMRVETVDVRRQLGCEDQSLAEAADAVWAPVAPQVSKESSPRSAVARMPASAQPSTPDAKRLLIEVFRKVEQLGVD